MKATWRDVLVLLLSPALLALGCGGDANRVAQSEGPSAETPPANAPAAPSSASTPSAPAPRIIEEAAPKSHAIKVVFLGDSLTAGYGLAAEEAYPALVEALLAAAGAPVKAINAGVSGDTSAGGLERLGWLLVQRPAIVFVCLGGNDGLRGLPLESTEANLRAIVERTRAAGARVVLAGMQIPPNYGPEYTAGFRALYPRLAEEYDVPLVPFLLEGVAARPELNQRDGIHPNAEGQKIVARTVADALAPLLREALS
ncbi:MAG: arylesterase [Myxococcota bacterium]